MRKSFVTNPFRMSAIAVFAIGPPPDMRYKTRCCCHRSGFAAYVSQLFRVPADFSHLVKHPRWYFRKAFTTDGIAGHPLLSCCHPLTTLKCSSDFILHTVKHTLVLKLFQLLLCLA